MSTRACVPRPAIVTRTQNRALRARCTRATGKNSPSSVVPPDTLWMAPTPPPPASTAHLQSGSSSASVAKRVTTGALGSGTSTTSGLGRDVIASSRKLARSSSTARTESTSAMRAASLGSAWTRRTTVLPVMRSTTHSSALAGSLADTTATTAVAAIVGATFSSDARTSGPRSTSVTCASNPSTFSSACRRTSASLTAPGAAGGRSSITRGAGRPCARTASGESAVATSAAARTARRRAAFTRSPRAEQCARCAGVASAREPVNVLLGDVVRGGCAVQLLDGDHLAAHRLGHVRAARRLVEIAFVPGEGGPVPAAAVLVQAAEEEGGVRRARRAGETAALGEQRPARDVVVTAVAGGVGQRGQVLGAARRQHVPDVALGIVEDRIEIAGRQRRGPALRALRPRDLRGGTRVRGRGRRHRRRTLIVDLGGDVVIGVDVRNHVVLVQIAQQHLRALLLHGQRLAGAHRDRSVRGWARHRNQAALHLDVQPLLALVPRCREDGAVHGNLVRTSIDQPARVRLVHDADVRAAVFDRDVGALPVDARETPAGVASQLDDRAVPEPERRLLVVARDDRAARGDRAALDLQRERRRALVHPLQHVRGQHERGDAGGRGSPTDDHPPPDAGGPAARPVPAGRLEPPSVLGLRHVAQRATGDPRQIGNIWAQILVTHDRLVILLIAVPPRRRFGSSDSTICDTRMVARRSPRLTVASESSIASAISSRVMPSMCRRTRTRRSRVLRRSSRL